VSKPERWLLAEALAHEDGETQAQFFNAFFAELNTACRADNRRKDATAQTPYIAPHLDGCARKCIAALASDCEYEEQSDRERSQKWAPTRQELYDLERRIAEAEAKLAEVTNDVPQGGSNG
jgi:hypothetical protein